MDFFVKILFGHVVGDFFLQPAWMATKKGSSNKLCALHCFIYTLSILAFTEVNLSWGLFIFVSHFVVDRFSLGDVWLRFVRGRDLDGFCAKGHENIPVEGAAKQNYLILRGGFSCICYVIVDNFIHLMSMYYVAPHLLG